VPGLTPSFAPGFDSAVLAQPELNYAVATMPQPVAPFGAPSNPYAPPAPVAPFGAPNPYAAPAPVAPFGAPPSPYPTPGFAPFNPIAPGALPPAYPAPPAPQPQFGPAPMQSPFASPVPAPMTAYNQAPSPTPFFNPGFNASLPANPFSAVAQPALASNGAGLSSQRAAAPSLVSVPESARLKSIAANYDQVAQRYKEAATVYESAESVNQYNPQLAQTIISDHFQRHPF
ncbi:MAG: hypothetical protein R2857_15610, partial [Vampirovibrionales bacterium]